MDGVQDIHDPKWRSIIQEPFALPCLQNVPKFPILGNHDYKGNANAQIAYSKVDDTWRFPNRFYSVNFNNVLELIALDSNYLDYCSDPYQCAMDFLMERKENSTARWKIAIGHHIMITPARSIKLD